MKTYRGVFMNQYVLYYCTIALICHVVKVKTVIMSVHSMADIIPFFSVFNIPFESNALIKPKNFI